MSSKQTLEQAPANALRTTTWTVDPSHSQAEFAVRHMMISTVRGAIPIRSATIVRDESDITKSRVTAELDVAGLSTGSADRDKHLHSPDFFDVEHHPSMRFASTRIETVEDGLRVHGDLTIRDVTRPVILDVELVGEAKDPWGDHRAGIAATTSFDRRDFGLTWNAALEAGGVLVADKVKVTLNLQAVKQ